MEFQRATSQPPLTHRQHQVLDYLRDYITSHGYPPSYDEIRYQFGFASLNAVRDVLIALERKGYLVRQAGRSRALQLVIQESNEPIADTASALTELLTIIGSGTSANPLAVFLKPRGTVAVDARFWGIEGKQCFVAIAPDDALSNDGIRQGDWLVVEHAQSFAEGAVVVCLDERGLLVRRCVLDRKRRRHVLQPSTQGYSAILTPPENPSLHLLGTVRGVMRRLV